VTARITHASPAAAYAHSPERLWEGYDSVNFGANEAAQGCTDIARQLVSRSPPIDLLLGGGRKFFYPKTKADDENPSLNGVRTDNISLIDDLWKGRYIWNKTELKKIVLGSPEPLLGLFSYDHMRFETDRIRNPKEEPSLSEMTSFAVEHLLMKTQDKYGFFLFVEGSRIDHGHHYTKARYALDEYVEFDNTIGEVKRILKDKGVLDDTLLVVTADHSHMFSFGAGSARGSNIFGFATLENANVSDIDKMPVNIIAYGNGPNFPATRNRTYLDSIDFNSTEYRQPAALPLIEETHGGEDVAVFAHGPWSHLFTGTMEQHTIAHKMAYAACWDDEIKTEIIKGNGIHVLIVCAFQLQFHVETVQQSSLEILQAVSFETEAASIIKEQEKFIQLLNDIVLANVFPQRIPADGILFNLAEHQATMIKDQTKASWVHKRML
ncbi:unnamed protein product, partial [Didymodactylos carnosus]